MHFYYYFYNIFFLVLIVNHSFVKVRKLQPLSSGYDQGLKQRRTYLRTSPQPPEFTTALERNIVNISVISSN